LGAPSAGAAALVSGGFGLFGRGRIAGAAPHGADFVALVKMPQFCLATSPAKIGCSGVIASANGCFPYRLLHDNGRRS
jgi:hypothetical protein